MGFQARQRTADPRLACIPVCRPIKVNSTLSMDPGCRMPGRWYLSTPALQVCNHSSLGHCRHVPGSTLPTMAVTCALSSSGMMAVHAMLPRCARSPTNYCGTPLAARTNCACSDGVNGRQLTISLRLFSIPMRSTLGQMRDKPFACEWRKDSARSDLPRLNHMYAPVCSGKGLVRLRIDRFKPFVAHRVRVSCRNHERTA